MHNERPQAESWLGAVEELENAVMKLCVLLIAVLVTLTGCRTGVDPRLAGTFVSDRAATVAYLESTGHYRKEALEKIARLFGRLNVRYKGNTYISVMDGYASTNTFRVVSTGTNHVVVEISDRFGAEEGGGRVVVATNRIEFSPDGYWLSPAGRDPFKEKFVRKSDTGKR